jgi:hypothetical protein
MLIFYGIQAFISQRMQFFITTAGRTSNPTYPELVKEI